MPIYEYRCTECGELTEILQKLSDMPEKKCPHCHKDNLVKQVSSPSFQLKGTGWYVTDFKNKKENKAEIKTEKPDAPKTTETKSAEKTDAVKTDAAKTDAKKTEVAKTESSKKPEKTDKN